MKIRGIYSIVWGVFFLGVAIAGQEAALRLAMPSVNPAHHIRFIREHGDLPMLGPANRTYQQIKNTGDYDVTVHFNRYGLRESQDIAQATAQDLFLVGDSFAFGWGVEESDRVSHRLAELSGVRVFNPSITGNFDTYEKLLDYAAAQGANVQNVIIMVTMENDLAMYTQARPQKQARKSDAPKPVNTDLMSIKEFLMANSALYFALTSGVHRVKWIESLAEKIGLIAANLDDKRRPIPSAAEILSSAERLSTLAKRFHTTVAIIPSRLLWYGEEKTALDSVHKKFIGLLDKFGVDVIDLRPAFERLGAPLSLHFHNDPHWTAQGHRVAAQAIARHLQTSRAGAAIQ